MNIRYLFLFLLLSSCATSIDFRSPQPDWRRDEKSISRRFSGTYKRQEDSTFLTIDRDKIIQTARVEIRQKVSDLDSADRAKVHGDTTYTERYETTTLLVQVKSDNVFLVIDDTDTLLCLSCGDKIRRIKKVYYINRHHGENSWQVSTLTLTKDGVLLGAISRTNDLPTLQKLTNSPDSIYTFNPTKEQMTEFIKTGFSEKERFVKLKKR